MPRDRRAGRPAEISLGPQFPQIPEITCPAISENLVKCQKKVESGNATLHLVCLGRSREQTYLIDRNSVFRDMPAHVRGILEV